MPKAGQRITTSKSLQKTTKSNSADRNSEIEDALPKVLRGRKKIGTVRIPPINDPAAFALSVTGDCMAPEIEDGDKAIVSPAKKIVAGMIVILFQAGREVGGIKRLVELPRPRHPDDEVVFPIVVQQENPPRQYFVNPTTIEKMHAVVGVVRAGKFIPLKASPGKITGITNVMAAL